MNTIRIRPYWVSYMEWSQLRGNFGNESDKVWLHMSDGEVVHLMGRDGGLKVEQKKII